LTPQRPNTKLRVNRFTLVTIEEDQLTRHHGFRRAWLISAASAALLGSAMVVLPATVAASGNTRLISASGTASFKTSSPAASTSGIQSPEFPQGFGADEDGAEGPDRSHSGGGGSPVGAIAQPKNVTTSAPELARSFDGLNHFQQRFGSTDGNNAFSLEPPDQGLCANGAASNSRVLEVVNDVLRVYDGNGNAVSVPQALNSFLGYAPAFNRTTGDSGPFVTDPSCLYDPVAGGHWFLDVLTLDTDPSSGNFTGGNHIDLAVSNTSDPAGTWTIYRVHVEDDGTNGQNHSCSPADPGYPAYVTHPAACFGDYPHIGADANGVYITTNEYSFFGPEFHGAQIYAFSKTELAARPATIGVTQIDTHGSDTFGFAQNGFTVWPSATPNGGGDLSNNGTEWFLSSNAGAEAHDTGDGTAQSQPSTQLLVWALKNTASLTRPRPSR